LDDRGPDFDPAKRYYVREGAFSASSWSPEAARALARQMQDTARRAERGPLNA
jgi:hypothetical protein